jgi:hypothetical protein
VRFVVAEMFLPENRAANQGTVRIAGRHSDERAVLRASVFDVSSPL